MWFLLFQDSNLVYLFWENLRNRWVHKSQSLSWNVPLWVTTCQTKTCLPCQKELQGKVWKSLDSEKKRGNHRFLQPEVKKQCVTHMKMHHCGKRQPWIVCKLKDKLRKDALVKQKTNKTVRKSGLFHSMHITERISADWFEKTLCSSLSCTVEDT